MLVKSLIFSLALGVVVCIHPEPADCNCPNTTANFDSDKCNYGPIVATCEWKRGYIADEYKRYLGPARFAGVQVSCPAANLSSQIKDIPRPWCERPRMMSYNNVTLSRNGDEFMDIVESCFKVGVMSSHYTPMYSSTP